MKRDSVVAFACGMKGAGKTEWLARTFVDKAPRVIYLDMTGEHTTGPDVLAVAGYDALLEAIAAAASYDRWRIAVALDDKDVPELFKLLAPTDNFGEGSLARALRGVALECSECDVIAPNGRTEAVIKSAWKRSRHHRLDLLMATQRPAECDRIVTSQADVVAVFALEEHRDLVYVRERLGEFAAREVLELEQYHCIVARRGERCFDVLDARRRVVRRVDKLTGARS